MFSHSGRPPGRRPEEIALTQPLASTEVSKKPSRRPRRSPRPACHGGGRERSPKGAASHSGHHARHTAERPPGAALAAASSQRESKTSPRPPPSLATGAPHHRQLGSARSPGFATPRDGPQAEAQARDGEVGRGGTPRPGGAGRGARRASPRSPPGPAGRLPAGRAGGREGRPRERGAERRGGRGFCSGAPRFSHPRLCRVACRPALFIRGRGRPRRPDWLPAAGSRGGSADARPGTEAIGRAAERAPPGRGRAGRERKKGKGPGCGGGARGAGRGRRGRGGGRAPCVRRAELLPGKIPPARAASRYRGASPQPPPGSGSSQQTALGPRPCGLQVGSFCRNSFLGGPTCRPQSSLRKF